MQDAPPHNRREGMMHVCQHARAQLPSAPRNFCHHRINPIRRGPGHQADDELRCVFGLVVNWHVLIKW